MPNESAPAARYYAYRVQGPWDPGRGYHYDPEKISLIRMRRKCFSRQNSPAKLPGRWAGTTDARCSEFYREAGKRSIGAMCRDRDIPITRWSMNYTSKVSRRAQNSGLTENKRGTFLGLIEKIPYLKELGVTVVELMPVHQFDPQEGNYWGYMTLSFFAPHHGYAVCDAVAEFREMVRAFHRAGIEIWLDVVYNHTCEGDETGPTYSYRGIENSGYYLLRMAPVVIRTIAAAATRHAVVTRACARSCCELALLVGTHGGGWISFRSRIGLRA